MKRPDVEGIEARANAASYLQSQRVEAGLPTADDLLSIGAALPRDDGRDA